MIPVKIAVPLVGVAGASFLLLGTLVTTTVQQEAACGGGAVGAGGPSPNRPDARASSPLILRRGEVVRVGATMYDGSTGSISGHPGQENLRAHPDSYAELSTLAVNPYPNFTFDDADALGRLPYMTPLRVSRGGRSMILYKRDIGFGQGRNTLEGHAARIDIYRPSAEKLGVSYSLVNISLAPLAGSGNLVGATPEAQQELPPSTGGTARPDSSETAAVTFAKEREGRVAFAVALADGTLVAAHGAEQRFAAADLTRAMVLVALTRERASGRIPRADRSLATAMIREGEEPATEELRHRLSSGAVRAVARGAGMLDFDPPAGAPLGAARVTAADQARFFARAEQLVPERHRRWALGLLADGQRELWGMLDAGLSSSVPISSGSRRGPEGRWTVTQAARFSGSSRPAGIAVLTDDNPSERYGQRSIQGVARALLARPASHSGCQSVVGGPLPLTPGSRARILPDGRAAAPAEAPVAVKQIIAAANEIITKPYVYGGGHGTPLAQISSSYDCSSSVSHALYGAKLLAPWPQTSGLLMNFGQPGPGRWVTIEANNGHVFMYVAGLRFDTSPGYGGGNIPPGSGPRWRSNVRPSTGFVSRHPPGL